LLVVTGGGMIARAAMHADDAADAARAANRLVPLSDEAIAFGKRLIGNIGEQKHHDVSHLNQKWTPIFEELTQRYGNLNDIWNKVEIPHQGRHPNEYHQWVESALTEIDKIAGGDVEKFRELFTKYVEDVLVENPWMLKKDWWVDYGEEFWEWWRTITSQGL